ncbi:unnamed protein product [Enterobius vermicularis]|uniref:EGF-like domain-containing protein n=1 Tax=Enterobius vermicularis TaxID=51028 RepID=A0A0N4V540_ENTVE|nr:unnamed protein product [Enterobius vermicularis]
MLLFVVVVVVVVVVAAAAADATDTDILIILSKSAKVERSGKSNQVPERVTVHMNFAIFCNLCSVSVGFASMQCWAVLRIATLVLTLNTVTKAIYNSETPLLSNSQGSDRLSKGCYTSEKSGREICHIIDPDTSCLTSLKSFEYPNIEHATFSLKYGLDECNCSEHSVQRIWFSDESVLQSVFELQKAFYFLQYECDFGYEFLDDAKLLYCRKGKWEPETLPRCVGKGVCRRDNGGCSHTCLAINNRDFECRCPEQMELGPDKKNCIYKGTVQNYWSSDRIKFWTSAVVTVKEEQTDDEDCVCRRIDSYGTLSCDCPKDQKPIARLD